MKQETKSKQTARRAAQSGFSLIELLVVVSIIAIIAVVAVVNGQRTTELAKERLAISRLHELAQVQVQYRVTTGARRYGTLAELRAAQTGSGPLMPPTLAPVDEKGAPAPWQGWLIRDAVDGGSGGEVCKGPCVTTDDNNNNNKQFGIVAVPADGTASKTSYCVFEDGVVRSAAYDPGPDNCADCGPGPIVVSESRPVPIWIKGDSCTRASAPVSN